jgi:hypothetical protein
MKASDDSRRLLRVIVNEVDLPTQPKEIFLVASLFRVHDDKEIDKEKGTSPTTKPTGGKARINWSFDFGKTFNLNNESGIPFSFLLFLGLLCAESSLFFFSRITCPEIFRLLQKGLWYGFFKFKDPAWRGKYKKIRNTRSIFFFFV